MSLNIGEIMSDAYYGPVANDNPLVSHIPKLIVDLTNSGTSIKMWKNQLRLVNEEHTTSPQVEIVLLVADESVFQAYGADTIWYEPYNV